MSGTKIYLTFAELVHLQQARSRLECPRTEAGDRLDAKLEKAARRASGGQAEQERAIAGAAA